MKKFMKNCAIAALILILVGGVLARVAGTIKGTEVVANVVHDVTNGNVQMDLSGIQEWGANISESAVEGIENFENTVNYDIDDATIFEDAYEICVGDTEKSFAAGEIKSLDIEAGGCTVTIVESEDADFHIETHSINKFQTYVEDSTLYVKGTIGSVMGIDNPTGEITLYVPVNYVFDEVELEIGAGILEMGNLQATKVALETGAGEITADTIQCEEFVVSVGMGECVVKEITAKSLEGDVGAGNLEFAKVTADLIEMECSMGNLEMEVTGAKEDYNYNIECGMGNLELGNETYSGIAQEKQVDNGSAKTMDIECAMGNVEISFTDK